MLSAEGPVAVTAAVADRVAGDQAVDSVEVAMADSPDRDSGVDPGAGASRTVVAFAG